ncbi:MAG: hypothetical protein NC131_13555 [Roseburia sp.]|nr:hypothetical protein [Roseburia sp.]
MNKIINNVLEGNLEVFIIPNEGGLVTKWLSESVQKSMTEDINAIAELSGFEFDPKKDVLVQLWFCGMECENLVDHFVHAEDEDGNKVMFRAGNIGNLPAKIFDGKKEGDTIDITFPVTVFNRGEDIEKEITVKATVTLAQTKYRYRRFGNFEEVLKQVI